MFLDFSLIADVGRAVLLRKTKVEERQFQLSFQKRIPSSPNTWLFPLNLALAK